MSTQKLKLKSNHTWKSKPGYSICVLDRGAVRFDYPRTWKMEMAEGAVYLHDREPSIESCDLGVSPFHVSREMAAECPVDEFLMQSLGDGREPYQQSEIHRIKRGDLEIAWLEQRYIEKTQNRDARFRVAIARGELVVLISMNYWANRAAGLERVWDEVLRTLQLGLHVTDPTAGPVVQ
jgi:hypothetical protein